MKSREPWIRGIVAVAMVVGGCNDAAGPPSGQPHDAAMPSPMIDAAPPPAP